jgi:hypothetical protein
MDDLAHADLSSEASSPFETSIEVNVLQLDSDRGKIIVSGRFAPGRQLRLPFGRVRMATADECLVLAAQSKW